MDTYGVTISLLIFSGSFVYKTPISNPPNGLLLFKLSATFNIELNERTLPTCSKFSK